MLQAATAFARMLVHQVFVKHGNVIYPLLTTIPGAGVMYLEVQDYVDDLPETVFDTGTFLLGAVALGGFLVEKAVRKFYTSKEQA